MLTAPRHPTTTGKVERLHKTMRAEFLTDADRRFATSPSCRGPGRLGGALQHRAAAPGAGDASPSSGSGWPRRGWGPPSTPARSRRSPAVGGGAVPRCLRLPGVQRWVDQQGLITLGGFGYRVPIVLAGEPVQAVAAKPGADLPPAGAGRLPRAAPQTRPREQPARPAAAGQPPARRPTDGPVVTRIVDPSGGVVRRHQLSGRATWRGARAGVRSWPGRCSSPARARSCGSIRSATTGPRSTPRSPPERPPPPAPRMRRPGPASRPRRCAVDLRPSLDPDPLPAPRGRGAGPPTRRRGCKAGTGTELSSGYRNLTWGALAAAFADRNSSIPVDERGHRCHPRTELRLASEPRDQWPWPNARNVEHAALAGIKRRGSRRTSAKEVWTVVIAWALVRSLSASR